MVDHAYEGLRAMCSVASIALLWISLEFGLLLPGETKPECLLALDLIGRAQPGPCCPDTLYKYLGFEHRFASIGLRAYCILSG